MAAAVAKTITVLTDTLSLEISLTGGDIVGAALRKFHAELGLRYRFAGGFLAGLSYMMQKSHFGATESYNNTNTVFNGIDDDVSGVMVTLGARF